MILNANDLRVKRNYGVSLYSRYSTVIVWYEGITKKQLMYHSDCEAVRGSITEFLEQ